MSSTETIVDTLLTSLPLIGSRSIHPNRGGYTATMREDDGADDVLASFARDDSAEEVRLHLGWGSFRNLDIVVARKSSFVMLCDVSLRQFDIWSKVSALLKILPERRDFVMQLPDVLPSSPRPRYFATNLKEWLESDMIRQGSWLASDKRYAYVRDLFSDDRVAHFCLDLRDQGTPDMQPFSELARMLRELSMAGTAFPDTIYLTNLLYMLAKPQGFFGESHDITSETEAMTGVWRNLALIAPLFRYVVSAHRLTESSTPKDPYWVTDCFSDAEFMRFLNKES